jgi:hypothetical protein
MLLLIGSLLLYGGRDASSAGGVLAVIVIVLLLALVGLFSLLRLGFGTVVPNPAPKQREGMKALPLLLVAVSITLLLGYFLVSASKS